MRVFLSIKGRTISSVILIQRIVIYYKIENYLARKELPDVIKIRSQSFPWKKYRNSLVDFEIKPEALNVPGILEENAQSIKTYCYLLDNEKLKLVSVEPLPNANSF